MAEVVGTEIEKGTPEEGTELALRPVIGETLYGFFDPTQLDAAMRASDFTVHEAIEVLIKIFRTSKNPWAQMAALKVLNEKAEVGLRAAGILATITGKVTGEGEGGQRIEAEAQTVRLLRRAGASSTAAMAPPNDPPTIDVEVTNVRDEDREEVEGRETDHGHRPPRGGSMGGLASPGGDVGPRHDGDPPEAVQETDSG